MLGHLNFIVSLSYDM